MSVGWRSAAATEENLVPPEPADRQAEVRAESVALIKAIAAEPDAAKTVDLFRRLEALTAEAETNGWEWP